MTKGSDRFSFSLNRSSCLKKLIVSLSQLFNRVPSGCGWTLYMSVWFCPRGRIVLCMCICKYICMIILSQEVANYPGLFCCPSLTFVTTYVYIQCFHPVLLPYSIGGYLLICTLKSYMTAYFSDEPNLRSLAWV